MRTTVFQFLLLILCGVATVFAFAPYYMFYLMPLLFAGVLYVLHRSRYDLWGIYLFALAAYASQFWWIHTALHDVSGLPNLFAIPLTFLLPAFLALFPLLAWRIYRILPQQKISSTLLGLPVVWTLTEFARERLFTGFGWGALGYSQISEGSPLMGFVPIAGIHLATFFTVLWGVCLFLLTEKNTFRVKTLLLVLMVSVLAVGVGLKQITFTKAIGQPVRVALLQGNIAQQLKFDPEALEMTYQRYFEQVNATRADIVIMPETALPQMLQYTPLELLNAFAQRAKDNGSALAIGIPAMNQTEDGYRNIMLNASDLGTYSSLEDWQNAEQYAKNHLVPFGEYKPLPWLTEPLYRMMNMPLADFERGGATQKPFAMANQQVAFNICYEDGFGDELIGAAQQATLLANASNMAWYGDSNAQWQQLQLSQARALELGRYMVRATNTGATAIVAPNGLVEKLAPSNEVIVLEGWVQGMQGQTPYMKMGGSHLLMILFALFMALLLWQARKAA